MKKKELIKHFEENGANEVELGNANVHYHLHHITDEGGIAGYAVVKLDDGNFLLPYEAVDPDRGYEQFDVNDVRKATNETIQLIEEEIEERLHQYRKLFSEAVQTYHVLYHYRLNTGETILNEREFPTNEEAWTFIIERIERGLEENAIEASAALTKDNFVRLLQAIPEVTKIDINEKRDFVIIETEEGFMTWKIQKK